MTKICPRCGKEVEPIDLDEPMDYYVCDCGWDLCDTRGWADRMANQAEGMRNE